VQVAPDCRPPTSTRNSPRILIAERILRNKTAITTKRSMGAARVAAHRCRAGDEISVIVQGERRFYLPSFPEREDLRHR